MRSERLLVNAFLTEHMSDAARVLERLPAPETAALLTELPAETASDVLRRMSAFSASTAVVEMDAKPAAAMVAQMPHQDASALLRRVEPEVRDSVVAELPEDVRERLRLLLRYSEGTAGALMDPFVLVLPDDLTVGEAISRTRRRARHVYYYVYVTDREQRLAGVLDLRELLLADAGEVLGAVMKTDLMKVRADTDVATLEAHPGWQEFDALPVVDERGVFVGAVRHRAVRRMQNGGAMPADGAAETMMSLAELYWIGIGGMLRGLTGAVSADASGGGRNHAR